MRVRDLVGWSVVTFVAYVAFAKLGLLLALPPHYASPVWPAAGVALGLLLVRGRYLALAVGLGATFANALNPTNPGVDTVTAAIGLGSAVQAYVGATLVRRLRPQARVLATVPDVVAFAFSVAASCTVSATVGVTALVSSGRVEVGSAFANWLTWWVGDFAGALLFAPLVLLALGRPRDRYRNRLVPAGVPLLAVAALLAMLHQHIERSEVAIAEADLARSMESVQFHLERDEAEVRTALLALRERMESTGFDGFLTLARTLVRVTPKIRAIEWAPRVPASERAQFETRTGTTIVGMDSAGAPFVAGDRDEYVPVESILPIHENERALGFDLASDAVREEALRRALESDGATSTPPIRLILRGRPAGIVSMIAVGPREARTGVIVVIVDLEREVDQTLRAAGGAEMRWAMQDADARVHLPAIGSLRLGDVPDMADRRYAFSRFGGYARTEIGFLERRLALTVHRPGDVLASSALASIGTFLTPTLLGALVLGGLILVVTAQRDLVTEEVRARTADLSVARDEALRARDAKARFLAAMSHEIRTPMTGLLGVASLLEREPMSAAQRELVAILRGSGESLLTILDDILDQAAVDAGTLRVAKEPVDVRAAAEDVIALYRPIASQRSLALSLEWPSTVPRFALGDRVRLRQVLLNLVSNALKFTDEGHVTVRAERRDGRLRVSVTDSGIGVDPADIEGMFEPFRRADSGNTTRRGGTGLGLTIAKRLAEGMGGSIEATSAVGTGSVFTLVLVATDAPDASATSRPAAGPSQEEPLGAPSDRRGELSSVPATSPPDAPGSSAARRRVLLAEDNPVNAQILARMLSISGADADVVSDGRVALERCLSESYDLIMLDVRMPELDGLEVTRRLRAAEATGSVRRKIIGVTANASSDDRSTCLAAGMDAFLAKPVRLDDLREVLRTLA